VRTATGALGPWRDGPEMTRRRQTGRRGGDRSGMDRESPDFRATVRRDGVVRLVDWGPWLADSGPLYTLIDGRARAGVAIADLTVVRDDKDVAVEVIVDFRCGGASAHRRALCGWAASVGYRRIWLAGEVVDLEPVAGGAAQTRCTGCRARLVDAGESFWAFVRERGAFPAACLLCGSDLPQWTPARQTATGVRDPYRELTTRGTGCR
jgi:hypothetical protein